jgi:hypothetical protein
MATIMSGNGLPTTNSGNGDDDIMFGSIVFNESRATMSIAAPGGYINIVYRQEIGVTCSYPGGTSSSLLGSYTTTIGGATYNVTFITTSNGIGAFFAISWCAVKQ